MAITQTIATLPAVLNDSPTFYEDIAERNNSLVTTVLPSINAWATQANITQTEINAKAAQVSAQAVDGGYSQIYINTNFVGVNNVQTVAGIKTFTVSPIVPTPTAGDNSTKVATTAFVKAKSESDSIGVGQTWQDVKSSRSAGVTYTNNTGKPIMISVSNVFVVDGACSLYIDNVLMAIQNVGVQSEGDFTCCSIIPNGSTYKVTVVNNIQFWFELR